MNREHRNLAAMLVNYLVFTLLTGLGGYLFVTFPQKEALGGMVLGLSGVIAGILMPFHLWRKMGIGFRLLPEKQKRRYALVSTCIFIVVLVGLYPSGILGNRAILKLLAHPPDLMKSLITFAFLCFSAMIYALLFWGGLLHTIRNAYGTLAAVLITSVLFSLYHVAEFAFTPPTLNFLLAMFIGSLMCTAFTIYTKSVLPTLIAQQFGQFVHFAAMEDNPFSEPAGLFANMFLLVLVFGFYVMFQRKRKRLNN